MRLINNNILSRYLIKEALNSAAVMTFFLLLIFLSNQLVRLLSYAASGKVAANILLQLIGFEIPYLLAFLLPLGFFLGVIWAYGGLYANNELRVMHACGVSVRQLIKQISVLAFIVMLVVLILMLWINPWIARAKDQLIAQGKSADNIIDTIMPGRFQASKDGNRVMYVEQMTRNHQQANNVFVANQKIDHNDPAIIHWSVLSAERGYQTKEQGTQQHYLVAEEGNRYEGTPGQSNYKIIHFQRYKVHEPNLSLSSRRQEWEEIPTHQLLQSYDNPSNAAELQWRLSIPLSVMLLALLAIPFSQVKPRQGRYLQLILAILIYIVYINLLFVSRNWMEQKLISVSLGMWWVHLSLMAFIIWMLMGKNKFISFRRTL
jgi:lipopolysaccharide export system permease protein